MALGGLLALQLDPPDFSVAPAAIAPLLLAYLAFSVGVLLLDRRAGTRDRRLAWVDLGFCLSLVAVTGGTSSLLFFFLLFPIMSRAFREGFAAGWGMTLAATAGFLLVGLPTSPGGVLFEFNRAMIRPLTLLILGYIVAREGGVQKRTQRRLALLAQLDTAGNPRFGAGKTLLNAAQRIRDAYAVRECLILLDRGEGEDCLLARASARDSTIEVLPAAAVASLLALPADVSVLREPGRFMSRGSPRGEGLTEQCEGLADMLDSPALLSVPMHRGDCAGRVFLLDARLAQFDEAEMQFLEDAAAHLVPIVERIDLLDRLASLAAQRERRRLAHDLHDMAIQPYVGIQMGLEAALRRPGCPEAVVQDLRSLVLLAQQSVEELRRALTGQRAATGSGDMLGESVARLARQYRDQFAIDVAYECEGSLGVSDRLAADLFGMMCEGLSNVRRHTASRWARLRLHADGDALQLTVANERRHGPAEHFVPKSLRDRARELGGDARVEWSDAGETRVQVRIPL